MVSLLVLAACGGGSTAPDDADTDGPAVDAAVDTPAIDAPMIDAPMIDAVPIDAVPVDAPPLNCTQSFEMLLDIAPLRIWSVAALGDTVYFTTYDPDDIEGGGEVRAISMNDLAATTIGSLAGIGLLRVIDGWLYVADAGTAGSLWRYQPGQPIQTLATNRMPVVAVTADATQVFWWESNQQTSMLVRAPIAGGMPTTIEEIDVWRVAVDDQRLYAIGFSAAIGYRKDNWFRNWYGGQFSLATDLLIDDGELLVLDLRGVHAARPPSMTFTPLVNFPQQQDRPGGMTLHDNYLWITAGLDGIKRVHRQGGALELVTAAWASAEPVFAGQYLAWKSDGTLSRCEP